MTLTEKWKKGELERGRYYIKYRGNYMQDNWHGDCWEDSWSEYVEEVLAPVPDYKEWQLTKYGFDDYKRLCDMRGKIIKKYEDIDDWWKKENQQLKELLKECREWIEFLDVKMKSEKNPKNAMYFEVLLMKIDNAIGEKK